MNILLLGYGKMGKTIEQIALSRQHHIAGRIDLGNVADRDALRKEDVDVVIEFSSPEAAFDNITYCLRRGWPVVSGTTGWLNRRAEVESLRQQTGCLLFYASNYSIGVNLFFRLNKVLAQFMHNYPSYRVSMTEIHHTEKKDSPSGTAITLAEGLLEHLPHKSRWEEQTDKTEAAEEVVPITSVREGTVPGTHVIRYDSPVDTIEIQHVAHSREGFALGAVMAAEWLVGQNPGSYGMDDLLG